MFCIYIPCVVNTVDNLKEYKDLLNEVSIIISNNNALYVCIASDLNADFSRATSWHTRSLNNLIEHVCRSEFSNSKVDYSNCHIALAHASMFVHIAVALQCYVTLLNRANSVQRWMVFKKCSAVQCGVVKCSAVRCSAVQSSTVQLLPDCTVICTVHRSGGCMAARTYCILSVVSRHIIILIKYCL